MSDNKAKALLTKEKGNIAYKNKNFSEALKHYDTAISLDKNDITFLINKAAVYFELKQYENCIRDCDTAIEVGRGYRADYKIIAKYCEVIFFTVLAYSRMASAYAKLEDYEKAKTFLQKSLSEHRTPETLTKLSKVYMLLKEKERMEYLNPDISLEEKILGNILFQKGDYPAAIYHYTESIKRNPEDAKIYSNRAACYQKLAEFNLALKDCDECIRLDANFLKGYIRKGYALIAMKDLTKAKTAFQKALKIDENNQEAIKGFQKCVLSSSNTEDVPKRAMNDPEVQKILTDSSMRHILEQMQSDPKALQEHLKNPDIASKIYKLMESGLLDIR